MKDTVTIILVQETKTDRDNGKTSFVYRIAKLIGTVSVYTDNAEGDFHVGDVLDEETARDPSVCRDYEVTVTAQKN
jgi:hypothetical protein